VTAQVIDGREVARGVLQTVTARSEVLRGQGVHPHLAFVTLGISAPAQMYLHRLERLGTRHGIIVSHRELREDVSLEDLDDEVARLNADDAVDGVIVQMPLPDHLTSADLSTIIDPRKDVDGITVQNAGRLYLGLPGQAPSTGRAMMEVLDFAGIDPLGCHAVVIGRSHVVGHPVAEMLLQRDATVTVTHRQTQDLASFTRQADVLLVGAGEAGLVRGDMVRKGVVIVDAGINVTDAGIVGDVVFDECLPYASAITPVPGGVGPVTNAVLLRNVVDSAERRVG
jgi:methylenetetrahydrofolate dehydrogenase (NADP+)/methenyltetrahydrofolate cyclohydrolase